MIIYPITKGSDDDINPDITLFPTGNVVLPSETDVVTNVAYGSNSELIGTYLPSLTICGDGGFSIFNFTGHVVLPDLGYSPMDLHITGAGDIVLHMNGSTGTFEIDGVNITGFIAVNAWAYGYTELKVLPATYYPQFVDDIINSGITNITALYLPEPPTAYEPDGTISGYLESGDIVWNGFSIWHEPQFAFTVGETTWYCYGTNIEWGYPQKWIIETNPANGGGNPPTNYFEYNNYHPDGQYAGKGAYAGAVATGSIEFVDIPDQGDIITIGSQTYTCGNNTVGDPSYTLAVSYSNVSDVAADMAWLINNSLNGNYTANANAGVVSIEAVETGDEFNATISTSNETDISVTGLSGGVDTDTCTVSGLSGYVDTPQVKLEYALISGSIGSVTYP